MENEEQWETIANNLTYTLHRKQYVFMGGTKVIGKGTRGRFFSIITTYPYCADPMESPEGFPPPQTKKVDYCVKSCTIALLILGV